MNAPEKIVLPDIQSQLDGRDLSIDAVGIKDVRYPVLNRESRVLAYAVEAENFESIHNHSALARILRPSLTVKSGRRQRGYERSVRSWPTEFAA
jgi:GTP cyclohydrolase FolE2